MKVLIYALLWICASGTTAWEVHRVEEIVGKAFAVLIDSESNAFVIDQNPSDSTMRRLIKLDPRKRIILEENIIPSITNLYMSNNNDFYLTTWARDGSTIIYTVRPGSSRLERIAEIGAWVFVYMDNDGNLMYNGEDSGSYFLRRNTNEVFRIQNLENFKISNVITDKNGDTYLGTATGEHQFAVITAESKENTPEGVLINGVFDDTTTDIIYDLQITGNNELLISIFKDGTSGTLKRYSNNILTTLLSNEGFQFYKLWGNDRITLITSCDYYASRCRLSYLTLNGDIVEISNLLNKTTDVENINCAFTEEGNVFLSHLRKIDQSILEFLNYGDTRTIPIDFNVSGDIGVYNVLTDGNDDLWILTNLGHGIFNLEKGSLNPEQVPGTGELDATAFTVDKRTNEIFALTENGLYIVTK